MAATNAEQTRVDGDNDCAYRHEDSAGGRAEHQAVSEKCSSGEWDGDCIVAGRPEKVLDHFAISGAGKTDDGDDVKRVAANQDDVRCFHSYVGASTDCDAD